MISHGRNSNKLLQDVSSVRTGALGMPGRNVCNFLQFYNFAMWVVVTFQLQNINSGFVEFEGGAKEDFVWPRVQGDTALLGPVLD